MEVGLASVEKEMPKWDLAQVGHARSEQRSVSSSTRLDPFEKASNAAFDSHLQPHNFSVEVDIGRGWSKVAPSIPTWVDRDDCVESYSVSCLGGSERCSSDPIG